MEAEQARDGANYFANALKGVEQQAGAPRSIPLDLKLRLREKRDAQRAEKRQADKSKPARNPFAVGGWSSSPGKNTITAVGTGSRRGSLMSAAPIPQEYQRKLPEQSTRAGPSRTSGRSEDLAKARRNLTQSNQNGHGQGIQSDSDPRDREYTVNNNASAGSSHDHQTACAVRTMHRSDGKAPPPIFATPGGGRRSNASGSRSASPLKLRANLPRPSYTTDREEEEEPIENPNGKFRTQAQDQGDSDIVYLDQPGQSSSKATNSAIHFTLMADRTRGAARSSNKSASPTRTVAERPDTKGKGNAVAHDVFMDPGPAHKRHVTRSSKGSMSPERPTVEHVVTREMEKGKGKAVDSQYIEIDDRPPEDGVDADHRATYTTTNKNKTIPPSGILSMTSQCATKVVWCIDLAGQKRKLRVWQVELHPDGIELGDPEDWKRTRVYINILNIIDTKTCERKSCPLIVMTVSTETDTKVDSKRLQALIAPAVSGLGAPTDKELSTIDIWIPLKATEQGRDFVLRYNQMTSSVMRDQYFRLSEQKCREQLAGAYTKPPHRLASEPLTQAAAIPPPVATKSTQSRDADGQISNHAKKTKELVVDLSRQRTTAEKQSAKSLDKGKQRELEPHEARQSKVSRVVSTLRDALMPVKKTRSSTSKTKEPLHVGSDDEEIRPEPPKPPSLAPPSDRTTVLFPYPLTGRATLSITKIDLWRVMSGEFLNDTLIEWGLQHLLSNLEGASASDVHLFNSFFYTKISTKERDKKLQPKSKSGPARWPAFEAIRKWTKSVDVFTKKFIIVPINEDFHWYLAVIYNPGGMLVPPPPEPASVPDSDGKVDTSPERDGTIDANDENIVDNELGSAAEGSDPNPAETTMVHPSSDEPMDIDPEEGDHTSQDFDESFDPLDCIERTPPVAKMKKLEIHSREAIRRPKRSEPPPPGNEIVDTTLEAFKNQHEAPIVREKPPQNTEPVKPVAVKAEQKPDHVILNSQKPWIITFDSLGSQHKAVGTALSQWLLWEAKDKKGLQCDHVQVEYTHAQVQLQTNFSDCGLYLVHYARKLLNDPENVLKFIERRLPHKNSDERKQYNADLDNVWGITRDHNLRHDWEAMINSLKEQYEGQSAKKPIETKLAPAGAKLDEVVEGDSGEGFLEHVPENGEPEVPLPDDGGVVGQDGVEAHSDHIVAERPSEDLDHTSNTKEVPSPIAEKDDMNAARSFQSPHHQDYDQSSTAKRSTDSPSQAYADELESDGEDDERQSRQPLPQSQLVSTHSANSPFDHNRGNELLQLHNGSDSDAVSSALTPSTDIEDTGEVEDRESSRAMENSCSDVDPELSGPAPPTTNLEDENMGEEHDDGTQKPPPSRVVSPDRPGDDRREMIRRAGLLHESNPNHPQNMMARQLMGPGQSVEDAIDIDEDEGDDDANDTSRPRKPAENHFAANEPEIGHTETSKSGRVRKSLFDNLTPTSASARKHTMGGPAPATSPLTSLGASTVGSDTISAPPSFLPETPSGSRSAKSAKEAPPTRPTSVPPWLSEGKSGKAQSATEERSTPISALHRFADLDSVSSAETTPARNTPVHPSTTTVGENFDAQGHGGLSKATSIPLSRTSSGGLERLLDPSLDNPSHASPRLRGMALDRRDPGRVTSSPHSATSVLDNDVRLDQAEPHDEDRVNPMPGAFPQETAVDPNLSNVPDISPAKRQKTVDRKGEGPATRHRPSAISIPERDSDDVIPISEGSSSPVDVSSLPLPTSKRTGPSGSTSAPLSKRKTRSSLPDITLVGEDDVPEETESRNRSRDDDSPAWAQMLLGSPEYPIPSTSTSVPTPRQQNGRTEADIVLTDEHGNPDDLESRSEGEAKPAKSRRTSPRKRAASPQMTGESRVLAPQSSGDEIEIQDEKHSPGLPRHRTLARSAARVATYGGKAKNKEAEAKKSAQKPLSHKQTTLPYGSSTPTTEHAGPSTRNGNSSANPKRHNEHTPESASASKRKKFAEGALGHTPARLTGKGEGPKTRKGKSKGKGKGKGNSHGTPISVDSEEE